MIDYTPLWHTMANKGYTQYYLLQHGIDHKTLDSLKKEKNITLLTLEKLAVFWSVHPTTLLLFEKTISPK